MRSARVFEGIRKDAPPETVTLDHLRQLHGSHKVGFGCTKSRWCGIYGPQFDPFYTLENFYVGAGFGVLLPAFTVFKII